MVYQFRGKISKGNWSLNPGQPFDAFVAGKSDGNYYLELHKDKGAPKTSPQQGYYYGVVVPHTLKALKEQGNEDVVLTIGKGFKHLPLMKENIDQLLKGLWARDTDNKVKSKADFSLDEYSELIDISIQWVAKYLSYVIPPPDINWRQNE
ncbi:hypothetical protein LCGC14_1436380 [marine sediment metagenome]|uniref:Uncharacterized protein n=1 Tax=marine sediment metagenome TaxID=412755 RepID=A0A0F9JML9_9ZZZZ